MDCGVKVSILPGKAMQSVFLTKVCLDCRQELSLSACALVVDGGPNIVELVDLPDV